MKKAIASLMVLLVLVGCTTPKSEVTPTPVPSATTQPESTPTPEATKKPVDESIVFEKTSVKGLFDVYVANPLPEHMIFEVYSKFDNVGAFAFTIKSSDPNCTNEEQCTSSPYAFIYATEEEAKLQYLEIKDAIYQFENETVGTLYIIHNYTYGLNNTIQKGAPDYYEELSTNPSSLPIEELLSFEAR